MKREVRRKFWEPKRRADWALRVIVFAWVSLMILALAVAVRIAQAVTA